jgi:hypothetical protein
MVDIPPRFRGGRTSLMQWVDSPEFEDGQYFIGLRAGQGNAQAYPQILMI